jgi:hypothetical protein
MRFGVNEPPWFAKPLRYFCERVRRIVVLVQAIGEILSLSDVELSVRVAQDVNKPAALRIIGSHHHIL